jgi:hypothetical protein
MAGPSVMPPPGNVPHDAVHVVARGIEAADRRTPSVEHAGMLIGLQSGKGAKAARHDAHRVKGHRLDWRDTGIGAVIGIALGAVIGVVPRP